MIHPTLVVTIFAFAAGQGVASAECSIEGTKTIDSIEAATSLSACETFTGSIAIATTLTGAFAIDGVREITGSLSAKGGTLSELSADSLERIGMFELGGSRIETLRFPRLSSVDWILWRNNKLLRNLYFDSGITQASTIRIDETALSSLDGIDPDELETLYITSNPDLADVRMQSLKFSTIGIIIASGNNDTHVALPNLQSTMNIELHGVGNISFPSLNSVPGSIMLQANNMERIKLPVTTVGADLWVTGNENLKELVLPELATITRSFKIADNPLLEALSFDKLKTVGARLDLSGNLANVSLNDFSTDKEFSIASSEELDCAPFDTMRGQGAINGSHYRCVGNCIHPSFSSSCTASPPLVATPAPATPTPDPHHDGYSSQQRERNTGLEVRLGAGLGGAFVFFAFVGSILYYQRRARRQMSRQQGNSVVIGNDHDDDAPSIESGSVDEEKGKKLSGQDSPTSYNHVVRQQVVSRRN